MKHSTLALVLVLSIVLAAPAGAATVGIYAGGISAVSTYPYCIIPTIDLVLNGLEQPLKALELSVEIPPELQGHLLCVETAGVTITQTGDQYTIRLDDCWSARSDYTVPLFSLLAGAKTAQSLCMGPADPSPVEPPAITYETCDGAVVPLQVAPAVPAGIETADGCLWVAAEYVPTAESTWGILKTCY